MRELKFRAWNKEDKEWVYSNPMPDMGFWKWVAYDSTTIFNEWTGLKDCHGVDIYECDVVKVSEFKKLQLVSNNSGMQFELNSLPSSDDWSPLKDSVLFSIEVIGNVYENPELLK